MSWVKIHRQILDSEVFASEKQLKVWLWLLLKARYEDGFISIRVGAGQQTIKLKKGQMLFGRFSAEEQLSINGSTIYKIIKKFEQNKMILLESNSHYTLITIVKYSEYNDSDTKGSNQVTTEEQQSNNRVTTEEHKEESKEGKEYKESKEVLPPSEIEVVSYFVKNGYTEASGKKAYNYYSTANWKDSKGKKVKNWKQKMIGVWFKEENKAKEYTLRLEQ